MWQCQKTKSKLSWISREIRNLLFENCDDERKKFDRNLFSAREWEKTIEESWFVVRLIIRLDMHEWVIMVTLAGNRKQSEQIMTISPFLIRKTVRLWPPLSSRPTKRVRSRKNLSRNKSECSNKIVIYQRNPRRSIKQPTSNLNSIIRLLEIICALELSRESHFSLNLLSLCRQVYVHLLSLYSWQRGR